MSKGEKMLEISLYTDFDNTVKRLLAEFLWRTSGVITQL